MKRGTYRLDVALAARDDGGAVSFALVAAASGSGMPLGARAGTTTSGTAAMSIRMPAPGKRTVRVAVVATDPVGNERTAARTVRVP